MLGQPNTKSKTKRPGKIRCHLRFVMLERATQVSSRKTRKVFASLDIGYKVFVHVGQSERDGQSHLARVGMVKAKRTICEGREKKIGRLAERPIGDHWLEQLIMSEEGHMGEEAPGT